MGRGEAKITFRKVLLFFLLLLLIGLAGVAVGWLYPYKGYAEPEKFVMISRGASTYEIARQLQQEGIIKHWALFLSFLATAKRSSPVQAGEYRFDQPLSVPQVADRLVRGLVFYHEVTIPEGYSLFDIADLLEQRGLASAQTFRAAAINRTDLISDLAKNARNLEGFLFPDTYRLTRTTTADDIVRQMVDRFRQVYFSQLQPDMQGAALNVREMVTLASLIEKETGVDEERPLVSAVFHNRLKRNIPLQCDPTIIYAAKLAGNFRGEIYQSDLQANSPYNTYKRPGLPIGPIANPGIKSIEAALRPAPVDYLYFVSNLQGRHVFSSTLAQHMRAVAAYRSILRRESKQVVQKPGRS